MGSKATHHLRGGQLHPVPPVTKNPVVGEPKGPPLTEQEAFVQQERASFADFVQQERKNRKQEIANLRKGR